MKTYMHDQRLDPVDSSSPSVPIITRETNFIVVFCLSDVLNLSKSNFISASRKLLKRHYYNAIRFGSLPSSKA